MPSSPCYAYPDVWKPGSPTSIYQKSGAKWDNVDGKLREFDAFLSTPFYERPGFYSAPQTPITAIPLIFPSRRRKRPPALSSIVACSASLRDNSVIQSPCRVTDKDKNEASLGSGVRETFVWPTEKRQAPDSVVVTVEEEMASLMNDKCKETAPLGSPDVLSSGDAASPNFPVFSDPEIEAHFKSLKNLKGCQQASLTPENTATPNPDRDSSCHSLGFRLSGNRSPNFFSFTPLTSPALERAHLSKINVSVSPSSVDVPRAPEQDSAAIPGTPRDTGTSGGMKAYHAKDHRKIVNASPNDSGISLTEGELVGLMEMILETSENPVDEEKVDI